MFLCDDFKILYETWQKLIHMVGKLYMGYAKIWICLIEAKRQVRDGLLCHDKIHKLKLQHSVYQK